MARALEQEYGPFAEQHLAEVAFHLVAAAPAGDPDRAAEYARRAGRRAMRLSAYDEAVDLYGRALAALGLGTPEDERRAELLQALGEAQTRAGQLEDARATLLGAAEVARRLGDPRRLGRAALACSLWGLPAGRDDVLAALLEEACAGLEGAPRPPEGAHERDALLARSKALLATALYWRPDQDGRRLRLCDEAEALARAGAGGADGERTLSFVLAKLLIARWGPDSADRDLPLSEEVLELCRRVPDSEIELQARNWRITTLLERGELAAVDEEMARVERMAADLRQPRAVAWLPLHAGIRAVAEGRFEEGEQRAFEALGLAAQLPGFMSAVAGTAQLLAIRLLQGRLPEVGEQARAFAAASPELVATRCVVILLDALTDRPEQARRELDRLAADDGFARLPRQNTLMVALVLLAEVAHRLDHRPAARELERILAPFSGRLVVSPSAAVLWPVDRSLALVAATGGDADGALARVEAARGLARDAGLRPALALLALDEARLLHARDPARARELAGEAAALAAELGMPGLAADAAEFGAPAPGPEAAGAPTPARAGGARGRRWGRVAASRGRRLDAGRRPALRAAEGRQGCAAARAAAGQPARGVRGRGPRRRGRRPRRPRCWRRGPGGPGGHRRRRAAARRAGQARVPRAPGGAARGARGGRGVQRPRAGRERPRRARVPRPRAGGGRRPGRPGPPRLRRCRARAGQRHPRDPRDAQARRGARRRARPPAQHDGADRALLRLRPRPGGARDVRRAALGSRGARAADQAPQRREARHEPVAAAAQRHERRQRRQHARRGAVDDEARPAEQRVLVVAEAERVAVAHHAAGRPRTGARPKR